MTREQAIKILAEDCAREYRARYGRPPQFFKQQPGADIEPGWYWYQIPEGRDYPTLTDKLNGPFPTKREAIANARRTA
jgi:hypothetical protein